MHALRTIVNCKYLENCLILLRSPLSSSAGVVVDMSLKLTTIFQLLSLSLYKNLFIVGDRSNPSDLKAYFCICMHMVGELKIILWLPHPHVRSVV